MRQYKCVQYTLKKNSKKEMEWTSEYITQCFNEIIKDAKVLSSKELEIKHSVFKETFSKLYDLIIDCVISDNIEKAHNLLQMMLKARTRMKEGSMTKLATDMFVGNELGKEFIYPKTNVPSVNDYKQAFQKIKEKEEENKKEDDKKEDDKKEGY